MNAHTEGKIKRLRKMRWVATSLLGLMALVYGVARSLESAQPWLGWVRAFSEAAMVGALADWFAVVALFRHPLGLPIPHTAIIKQRKDEVGATLGAFVVENFLTREVIEKRVATLDAAQYGVTWLEQNAGVLGEKVCHFGPRLLEALDDKEIERFIHEQLVERLKAVEVVPLLGHALGVLTSGNRHEMLLQDTLRFVRDRVAENEATIASFIESELPMPDHLGGIPIPFKGLKSKLARGIATHVVVKIARILDETFSDPEHALRIQLRGQLDLFVENLKTSPEYLAKGEELKRDFLENPAMSDYATRVWADVKRLLLADMAKPDSVVRQRVTEFFSSFGKRFAAHDALRIRLNEKIRSGIASFGVKHASDAGKIIEETVRGWDAGEMARKLELEVGRDLQFIRINGTLIGGLVGVLLHGIGLLLF